MLNQTRIYIAACTHERAGKLPEQLEKLNLPYTLERELPNPDESNTKVHLDNPSRRFRQQISTHTDRPLLWLEDDMDIPDNFWEVWGEYEKTLPDDWCVAVIGWGVIYSEHVKIRRITPGWWHLDGNTAHMFAGATAILVNSGEWRKQLADKIFRCDVELHKILKEIGITQIYNSDVILIGNTSALTTSEGGLSQQYPPMTVPDYWIAERLERRKPIESDFFQLTEPGA